MLFAALLATSLVAEAKFYDTKITSAKKITAVPGVGRRSWAVKTGPGFMVAKGVKVSKTGEGQRERDAVAVRMANFWDRADISFAYSNVEAKFKRENSTVEGEVSGSAVGFYLAFGHVFEYVDGNGEAGFQIDDDTAVTAGDGGDNITGWYNLRSPAQAWNPIDCSSTPIEGEEEGGAGEGEGEGAGKVHSCLMSTQDRVFSTRVTATDDFTSFEDRDFTPNKVKIDIGINWFAGNTLQTLGPIALAGSKLLNVRTNPSTAEEQPQARLGLTALLIGKARKGNWNGKRTAETDAETGERTVNSEGEVVLSADADNVDAFFDWDTEIEGGAAISTQMYDEAPAGYPYAAAINKLIKRNQNEGLSQAKFIVFSFDEVRPDGIAWDPSVGVEENASARSALAFAAAAFAAAVAVVA